MIPVIPKINNSTNSIVDITTHLSSYRKYFCRQCYCYNCELHDTNQPLPANHGNKYRTIDNNSNGSDINPISLKLTNCTPKEAVIFTELYKLLNLKDMNILKTDTSTRTTTTTRLSLETFVPCNHSGPCTSQNDCICNHQKHQCEKYCGCSLDCPRRFKGCNCKPDSECSSMKCTCYASSRECDPDVCKCYHTNENGSLGLTCDNMNSQKGFQKKLLVKPSHIHGWGLYLGEDCEKDEYIAEYRGEFISQEEAERRGYIYDRKGINYLFNANRESVLDATKVGNKLRFANHSNNPNCYARTRYIKGNHRICVYAKRALKIVYIIFLSFFLE